MTSGPPTRLRAPVASRPRSVWRTALLAFLVTRVATGLALALAGVLTSHDSGLDFAGLLGWDATWYRDLSDQGYQQLPQESLRFFPALPLLVRLLSFPIPGSEGVVLLLVCNACALLALVVVQRLVTELGYSDQVAARTAWVVALAPSSYTSVMGYTEPVYLLLLAVALLALLRDHWATYAGVALVAGGLRPTGILLVVPALVVAAQQVHGNPRLAIRALLAAAAAPVGMASYLLWCRIVVGDGFAPFHVQARANLRGGLFVNTLPAIGHGISSCGTDGAGLHVLWAALCLVLLGLCVRRLPLPISAFAAASLVLALTARDLSSFERYAASTLPLLIVVATVLPADRRRVLAVAGAAFGVLVTYATMTFVGTFTP